ncbi:MAG: hypothetical protein D3924_10085 [Candidatus Electrothrix sp. AR4]|nr:hypothetical protein [Candidatus Electrothrix sp. AR4]
MLQMKKSILVKTALLLALTAYIGPADKAHAIEVTLPTSIYEILTPEQIDEAKADPAIKAKRNTIRGGNMTDQAAKMPSVMRSLMSNKVGLAIANEVGGQTSSETVTAQMAAMRDPASAEGMPIRLAAPEL